MKHAIVFAFLLVAAPCLAEEVAPTPGRFVALVPELADMPAPDWVKPGVRITYYGGAASTNESRGRLVEDPNGPWEDKKTGKRYRDTEETGEGNSTASGEGFSTIDIIAVDGNRVVTMLQLYLLVRTQGAIFPTTALPAVGTAANMEDFWVHPDALKKLVGLDAEGLRVVRGPVTHGDKTYDAVMIESTTGGAWALWTYDIATGLLLKSSTSTAGKADVVRLPTESTPRQGNTQRTMTRLAGVRDLGAKLVGGQPPDWVTDTQAMSYSGVTNMVNPVDGSSLGSAPTQAEVALGPKGKGWCAYKTTLTMMIGGMQNTSQNAGVSGGVGLFWADPKKLRALKAGEVIDEDPITGIRTTVGGVGTGPQGGEAVAIQMANGTFSAETIYDLESGKLVQVTVSNRATGMTTQVGLQGTR